VPLPPTAAHEDLVAALQDGLQSDSKPPFKWEAELRSSSAIDGFRVVLDKRVRKILFRTPQPRSMDDWVADIRNWLSRLWDPRFEPPKNAVFLSMLWEQYAKALTASLRAGRVTAAIPTRGGILAFIGGLEKCLVLRYEFAGFTPRFDVVAVIDHPRSAFDFWGAIDHASPNARNDLKSILASGHKLIYHRGVLIHVDRRADVGVFGPSIDTLVMNELLAREYCESKSTHTIRSALEVGSGSGMLSCCIAQHLPSLGELVCIDVDPQSIVCTGRNLRAASVRSGFPVERRRLIVGTFDPQLLTRPFDLVICNPPYIPLPPNSLSRQRSQSEYFTAIAGTELLDTLLKSTHSLLTPGGRMLLMLSSLCLDRTKPLLPSGVKVSFPFGEEGFQVTFDVEAVISDTAWTNYLLAEGVLQKSQNDAQDAVMTHRLHPVWIEREAC
jgi:methylase of polypeptide subunit release factors